MSLFSQPHTLTNRYWKRVAVALALAALICLPVMAQQTGITGRVTDPSNASVADVKVTATGADGSTSSTSTNASGIYQLPALRAGSYTIRYEIGGFAPA